MYAGIAIENSMLGAAHSAANPLTAHFGIVPGQAVGMMLPHVVRCHAAEPGPREAYRDLAVIGGLAPTRAISTKRRPERRSMRKPSSLSLRSVQRNWIVERDLAGRSRVPGPGFRCSEALDLGPWTLDCTTG